MKRTLSLALLILGAACSHNGRSDSGNAFDRFRDATNSTKPVVDDNDVNRTRDATNNTSPIVDEGEVQRAKDNTNTNTKNP